MSGDYNSRPESSLYRMIKKQLPVDMVSMNYDLDVEALSDPEFAIKLLKQRRG